MEFFVEPLNFDESMFDFDMSAVDEDIVTTTTAADPPCSDYGGNYTTYSSIMRTESNENGTFQNSDDLASEWFEEFIGHERHLIGCECVLCCMDELDELRTMDDAVVIDDVMTVEDSTITAPWSERTISCNDDDEELDSISTADEMVDLSDSPLPCLTCDDIDETLTALERDGVSNDGNEFNDLANVVRDMDGVDLTTPEGSATNDETETTMQQQQYVQECNLADGKPPAMDEPIKSVLVLYPLQTNVQLMSGCNLNEYASIPRPGSIDVYRSNDVSNPNILQIVPPSQTVHTTYSTTGPVVYGVLSTAPTTDCEQPAVYTSQICEECRLTTCRFKCDVCTTYRSSCTYDDLQLSGPVCTNCGTKTCRPCAISRVAVKKLENCVGCNKSWSRFDIAKFCGISFLMNDEMYPDVRRRLVTFRERKMCACAINDMTRLIARDNEMELTKKNIGNLSKRLSLESNVRKNTGQQCSEREVAIAKELDDARKKLFKLENKHIRQFEFACRTCDKGMINSDVMMCAKCKTSLCLACQQPMKADGRTHVCDAKYVQYLKDCREVHVPCPECRRNIRRDPTVEMLYCNRCKISFDPDTRTYSTNGYLSSAFRNPGTKGGISSLKTDQLFIAKTLNRTTLVPDDYEKSITNAVINSAITATNTMFNAIKARSIRRMRELRRMSYRKAYTRCVTFGSHTVTPNASVVVDTKQYEDDLKRIVDTKSFVRVMEEFDERERFDTAWCKLNSQCVTAICGTIKRYLELEPFSRQHTSDPKLTSSSEEIKRLCDMNRRMDEVFKKIAQDIVKTRSTAIDLMFVYGVESCLSFDLVDGLVVINDQKRCPAIEAKDNRKDSIVMSSTTHPFFNNIPTSVVSIIDNDSTNERKFMTETYEFIAIRSSAKFIVRRSTTRWVPSRLLKYIQR